MLRMIHCADLHLAEREREYSLAVFEELIAEAEARSAAAVLISGDLFDTYADAKALRAAMREIAESFSGEILYTPGNHEELQSGKAGSIDLLDLAPITVLHHTPCVFVERVFADVPVEILAIPHQERYGDYRGWNVPAKRAPLRVAMAHGIVTGLAYTGPDEETGAGMLDPQLFQFHQTDYAALGHIHARRQDKRGETIFCYPGSTRVWRRGESGARGFALLNFDPAAARLELEFVPLSSAGQYREIPVPLSLHAESIELRDFNDWHSEDYIELKLSGLIEDDHTVTELCDQLRARYGEQVRRFEIRRDDLEVLPGISEEPLVRKFLELWAAREPILSDSARQLMHGGETRPDPGVRQTVQKYERDRAVWLRSREVALLEIKRMLDARAR